MKEKIKEALNELQQEISEDVAQEILTNPDCNPDEIVKKYENENYHILKAMIILAKLIQS